MKIIKSGKPVRHLDDMIAECDRCHCVFTFGRHESERMSNGGGGSVYAINCPECGHDCSYDTGYPHQPELDKRVKAAQAWLRGRTNA